MIIEIPDELDGDERRRQIHVQMVAYAMSKFNSKRKAGKFLGYSHRWVRQMCQRNEELSEWRVDDPFLEMARIKGPGWLEKLHKFKY